MSDREKYYITAIIVFSLLITFLHLMVFSQQSPYAVLEELYYIPILFGAIKLGMKGAILAYLIVSVAYIPFFYGGWAVDIFGVVDRALHLLFTGIFAFLAGFFVARLKRQQMEIERNRYLSNLGQVAATIVHDLKNPLITIAGFAKRIQEGKGDINEAVEAITESAHNMQKIVNDVLDFSKPVQLELKEEDMKSVIKQASEACRAKAEEKKINLSVDMPNVSITTIVDSFNMQRALINIINNAIEASERGDNVKVSLAVKKKNLLIRIKDNGSGMDRETIENIFIPFYTKKVGGTGLGMPITKKIIDAHQGRILIKSEKGKGTEVTLELPYKLAS